MTRYPKSGKGKKWTQLELKVVPAIWKGDTLSDGGGLSGEVRVSSDGVVSIRFKYAFKWIGKVTWYQCGTWPTASMESIRASRDTAKSLVKSGVNPNDHKKADRIEKQAEVLATIAQAEVEATENLNFSTMYEAWIADGVRRKDGNAEIRRSFEKDVLPHIGDAPVKEISEHELRSLLRAMVERGVNRMAVRIYNDVVQLFSWAEARQPWRRLMIEGNPAKLLEIQKIVSPDYNLSDERTRVLKPADLKELRQIFLNMESTYESAAPGSKYGVPRPFKKETQLAVWICLSTLCRIGELLKSEWKDVDLENDIWFIPVENVKKTNGKEQSQTVSLSHLSREQFKALKVITGHTPYCFPAKFNDGPVNEKTVSKLVGDSQTQFKSRAKPLKNRRNDNSLVLNGGRDGEWTPHDMRRTGATMMQALGISLDVIDLCQNHALGGSRVRKSYLHHDYIEEKREAWGKLGFQLESIFSDQL